MEFLKFAQWWLKKRDTAEKTFLCLVPSILLLFISVYIFGPFAILVFIGLIASGGIAFLIYAAVSYFRGEWKEYVIKRDRERDQIINVLKGRRT